MDRYSELIGREIERGRRVKVYRNLTRGVYSVLCDEPGSPERGKVIAYRKDIRLERVKFHVNESGRLRVIRDRRKNVHAFVRGLYVDDDTWGTPYRFQHMGQWWADLTYNPYKAGHFCMRRTERTPFITAEEEQYRINGAGMVRLWIEDHEGNRKPGMQGIDLDIG